MRFIESIRFQISVSFIPHTLSIVWTYFSHTFRTSRMKIVLDSPQIGDRPSDIRNRQWIKNLEKCNKRSWNSTNNKKYKANRTQNIKTAASSVNNPNKTSISIISATSDITISSLPTFWTLMSPLLWLLLVAIWSTNPVSLRISPNRTSSIKTTSAFCASRSQTSESQFLSPETNCGWWISSMNNCWLFFVRLSSKTSSCSNLN